MSNITYPFNPSLPVTTPGLEDTSFDNANAADVNKSSEVTSASSLRGAASVGTTQDAYGVIPEGVRAHVLSTVPPVPADAGHYEKTSLPSAESRMAFLKADNASVGEQALTLGAEDPMTQIGGSPDLNLHQASASTSNPDGDYVGNDVTNSHDVDPEETKKAQDTSDHWVQNVGRNCKHTDRDMVRPTGLSIDVTKQAYDLMKRDKTDELASQVGMAMAVLAQEKQEGSPTYEADKAKVTASLQTLTDNYDAQFVQDQGDRSVYINRCDEALYGLNQVVTGHLGGQAKKPETPFDIPSAKPINPWA